MKRYNFDLVLGERLPAKLAKLCVEGTGDWVRFDDARKHFRAALLTELAGNLVLCGGEIGRERRELWESLDYAVSNADESEILAALRSLVREGDS